MTSVIGIDPGVRGGVAVLDIQGKLVFRDGFKPEMSETQIGTIMGEAICASENVVSPAVAYMEKVGYIRGDGGQGAFTFGQINGILKGFLLANYIPRRYVMPAVWQARMGCLTGGDKNVSKRRAIELFPEVKVTHSLADALLIAQYGYLVEPVR